jgi:hypothetical protein
MGCGHGDGELPITITPSDVTPRGNNLGGYVRRDWGRVSVFRWCRGGRQQCRQPLMGALPVTASRARNADETLVW